MLRKTAAYKRMDKVNNIFFLPLVLVLMIGCASSSTDTMVSANNSAIAGYAPEYSVVGRPQAGVISTARTNTVLYRQTPYVLHDSIRLIDAIALGENQQYKLSAGYYDRIAGTQRKGKPPTFTAGNFRDSGSIVAATNAKNVKWIELRENNTLCLALRGGKYFCDNAANLQRLTRRAPVEGALQQRLVFRGMDDDKLNFSYQEHSPEISMVMFEKALTYNARQTRIISYGGLVLEIFEASPSMLRYRVKQGFPPVGEARF